MRNSGPARSRTLVQGFGYRMNFGGLGDKGGREGESGELQSMEAASLLRHLPSVCMICGKRTRDEGRLRGHMSAKHKFPKPFRCKICLKEFCYNSVYRRHVKLNHSSCHPDVLAPPLFRN